MDDTAKNDESVQAIDVPQADNVAMVRAVVDCILQDVTNASGIAARLGITARHAQYCVNTARVLGWLELRDDQLLFDDPAFAPIHASSANAASTRPAVSTLGRELLGADPGSEAERTIVYRSILGSPSLMRILASDPAAVTEGVIAQRVQALSGLSQSTAERRAQAIHAIVRYSSAASVKPADAATVGSNELAYLMRYLERARFTLIVDWSFASYCKSASGKFIPYGTALAQELKPDMGELFDPDMEIADLLRLGQTVAGARIKSRLGGLLPVDAHSVPSHYDVWLSGPWQRIYYLGFDNLPAVYRQLNRGPRTLSVAGPAVGATTPTALMLYQLLGSIDDFHTLAFNAKERAPAFWNSLEVDVLASPILILANGELSNELLSILGTRQLKERTVARELRPKSFLIAPHITAAREALFKQQNITWIPQDSQSFGTYLKEHAWQAYTAGVAQAKRYATSLVSSSDNITNMADVVAKPTREQTSFLLGHEPQWSDIATGRAITRSFDDQFQASLRAELKTPGMLCVLTGTAGSGKSSSLMRAAYQLSVDGHDVRFVASDAEVAIAQLKEAAPGAEVIVIDDVDRYGREWPAIASELLRLGTKLVCVAVRSSRIDSGRVGNATQGLRWEQFTIPWLSDDDIALLLETLEREHRLGRLRSMTKQERIDCLREFADRQLIVAMIEATSGRRFDEKVTSEWRELSTRAQHFYLLTALSTSLKYSLSRRELFLAVLGDRSQDDLKTLDDLIRTNILVEDSRGRIRTRHRVIADKLLQSITKERSVLRDVFQGLAYSLSIDLRPGEEYWRLRRVLRSLINHEYLWRMLDLDGARTVYTSVEQQLHWDYHYWLQRGSLEVEEGDIRQAEQFLEQAFALNSSDRQVITEYAYMLMKKAAAQSTAAEAEKWLDQGIAMLSDQVSGSSAPDDYPYHVLGSGVLRWLNRCSWPRDKKVRLLEESLVVVKRGVGACPRSGILQRLEQDMRKKIHELRLGWD